MLAFNEPVWRDLASPERRDDVLHGCTTDVYVFLRLLGRGASNRKYHASAIVLYKIRAFKWNALSCQLVLRANNLLKCQCQSYEM